MSHKRKVDGRITRLLKTVIAESQMSYAALERQTGVKRQSLMKFMAGKQSLRLDFADKLAEFFELEIVRRKDRHG